MNILINLLKLNWCGGAGGRADNCACFRSNCYYAKKYKDDDFDYLYVYTADNRHFLIKWKEIKVRNAISLDDEKYQKYLLD